MAFKGLLCPIKSTGILSVLENDSDILFNVFNGSILNANGVIYNNLKNVFRFIKIIQFILLPFLFSQLNAGRYILIKQINVQPVIVLVCHLLVHNKIKKGSKRIALMIKTYN